MKKMKFVSWVVGYFFVGMMISNFDPVATVYAQDDNQIQTSAEENPTIYRTVTFDSNGGSEVAPVKVEHAYRVAEPEAPTRPGYTFKGWNKEGSQQAFGFAYETVKSDITLVAQWEKNPTIYRTVTFDSNGGSEVAPVKVEHAYRVAEPEAPTRPGYTFKGWNKEGSQQAFGFAYETVKSDITLVAQWEKNPTIYRTVTFDSNGGSEVAPVKVEHAYRVAEPEAPTRPGYTFKGWNKEGSQQAFDFVNEVVTSDITLVAQWEEELLSKENDQSRNDMKKEKNSQKNSPQIISKVETKQLPKTGSINTNTTSFVGLLILGLMSIVIFYRYKKIKIK